MQQAQALLQCRQQRPARRFGISRVCIFIPENGFGQFEVPVAVLVPDKLMQCLGGQVETIIGHRLFYFLRGFLEATEDPTIGYGQMHCGCVRVGHGFILGVHEHITRPVPYLVAEVAKTFGPAQVKLDIPAGGGQGVEGESKRIGAIAGDAVWK